MTPPNTEALRRSVYGIAYDILRASGGKIPRNPTAVTDEIMQLIAQYDQARLTAILAKACNYETYSKGHVSYEDAVPFAAITAAFEAVV